MPLSFEPSFLDGRQQLSTVTLQDVSQRSILRATIKELYASEAIQPDNRLLSWTRCLEERRKQHRAIETSSRRKPDALCMNSADDQRYLVEQRQILEFCRPPWPTKVCKLFDPGEQRSALCYGKPTLADRCIASPMAHVGVPKHIREEKDVLGQGDRKTTRDKWLENPNLAKKLEALQEQFHDVNPYEPEMDELAVVGNNMMRSVQLGSIIVPVISVYHENEFRETDDSVSSTSSQIEASARTDEDSWACIKINDRLLTWSHTPLHSSAGSAFAGSNSISDIDSALNVHKLIFKANVRQKLKEVLRFENIGNVKIRFSWHRKPDMDALPGSEAIRTSKFFFNKNSGVFLPGQIYEFPFWFETQRAGIFEEYWTLCTEPSMLKDGFNTCVQLYADAASSSFACKDSHKMSDINLYLDKRELESYAAELVYELADRRRPLKPTAIFDFLMHRDSAFADIGVDKVHFPQDLVERVTRSFGTRALDRLRAQHAAQPIMLKAHSRVSEILGEAIDRMEEHAERLRSVFGFSRDDDGEDGVEDDNADLESTSTRKVCSILKNETGMRDSLRRIAFNDNLQEFPAEYDADPETTRMAPSRVVREALATRMYFDLCNSVEDACSAMDELHTPRSARIFESLPVDRVCVPPPPPFVPAPRPPGEPRYERLPQLMKIYDFEGRREAPKKPAQCKVLEQMPKVDYTFDEIGVEDLPPLPKGAAAKGEKGGKGGKGGKDDKASSKGEGKKGAKGGKGAKSKK